ncbi:hypothetical protein QF035_002204 [Streptomyces umbrinus]|uniref:Uncharacterized protein n=1 Tax=Streptomyces umbrinus TaxID=67370 RepID=A0ABU0SMV4_9ACTN|nr:hypothetical protein [Streptomyces umbrinus]MDQ1024622.1 hypothetical protein [Streptomyces umbrinus]
MTGNQRHQRENEVTLLAMQALLGMISPDVIAVAVRVEEARVELIFWTHRQSSEIEDDAEEVTFELDALFSEDHPMIEYVIKIGEPDSKSNASGYRMIYWAKPDSAQISDE